MAIHDPDRPKKSEMVARWVLLIMIFFIAFSLCSRLGDSGVERDPFRGIDNPF